MFVITHSENVENVRDLAQLLSCVYSQNLKNDVDEAQ